MEQSDGARLAELLGGLCVIGDLSRGLEAGQGLRACVTAMRLAGLAEVSRSDADAVYWVSLLRFVGCTATATEMAEALGDELAVSAAFAAADTHDLRHVLRGAVAAVGSRPDRLLAFLVRAPGVVREHEVVSCEIARSFAGELGLPGAVAPGLGQVFERWDGKGNPGDRKGAEIELPVRLWQMAHLAELMAEQDRPEGVVTGLRERAGKQLDPDLVELFAVHATDLLGGSREADLGDVLAAEPDPPHLVREAQLETALELFGLVGDLKSPYFAQHSRLVADLAEAGARQLGYPTGKVELVRRAALVQDAGRVAVSSRVWNQADRLTDADREQVRLHPYYTHRALSRIPALADVAELASSHHERSDGTGYHRGLAGAALSEPAALLAAADRFVTAGEDRPYRPAMTGGARARLLETDADAGLLPRRVVDAVLAAADPARARPIPPPTDASPLTTRECEVLREVASGRTNVAAARRLGISPKTVNTHLEHAYAKLGVTTRTAAVVIATHRGLLTPVETDA